MGRIVGKPESGQKSGSILSGNRLREMPEWDN
jgi:hypothetical protein